MTISITAQEVTNLISGCTVDESIVESIITDATNYVTNLLVDCDGFSDAEMSAVVKWFAAHMLASGPCQRAKKERLGEAEIEYDTTPSKASDISSTPYGRMALALDRCGKLQTSTKSAIKVIAVKSFDE